LSALIIFVVRAILGILFAILVMRIFHPDSGMVAVMILAVIFVGLAYIFESFRKQKKDPGKKV
jgi:hypothetical protein